VHGSESVPTSLLVTGATYITTAGGSVNARLRMNVYRWNGSAWAVLLSSAGIAVFDQASISSVSPSGAKVSFHLTLTVYETNSYRFEYVNDGNVIAQSEHVFATLEVMK
jgi:hypothetical protein